jgi:hypothetical protein
MTKTNPNTVPLAEPIKVDGKEITSVTLRKPKSGELRGLKVAEIMQMDVDTMIKLLPRITSPVLDPALVEDLDADNFGPLAQKAMSFFLPKAAQDKIQAAAASL